MPIHLDVAMAISVLQKQSEVVATEFISTASQKCLVDGPLQKNSAHPCRAVSCRALGSLLLSQTVK